MDALIEERSVTRAASRLKIGQLFVRTGQAMQPTLRAEALAARVRDVLAQT